jgi:hypothetical protein
LKASARTRNVPGSSKPFKVEVVLIGASGDAQRVGLAFASGTHGYEVSTADFTADASTSISESR